MNNLPDHGPLTDNLSNDLSNARKQGYLLDSQPPGILPPLPNYKELRNLSSRVLPPIQQIFSTEGHIRAELCEQAIFDLRNMIKLLKAMTSALNKTPINQHESKISLCNYQLIITLYYTDELLTQLIMLIEQMSTRHRSKSHQVIQLREEIVYKLTLAMRSINDIVQSMQMLSDQARFQQRQSRQSDSQLALQQ